MKQMVKTKKFIATLVAVLLIVPFAFLLSACGANEDVIEVATYAELSEALSGKHDVVKLTEDIDFDTSLYITRKVTVELNGKTLKGNGYDGVFCVTPGGELTINGDGNIIAKGGFDAADSAKKSEYAMAIWAKGGNVVINGGKYSQVTVNGDSQYDMIYASDYSDRETGEIHHASITILSGEFNSVTPKWTLNLHDTAIESKFIVKGGIFHGYNPAEAMTEPTKPINFVAENYKAVLVEGSTTDYQIVKA